MTAAPTTTNAATPPVRVQDDLFRSVNGEWMAHDSIPSDQSIYGAFQEMRDQSEAACRQIIEDAAGAAGEPGSPEQLIGDLYTSFLDVDTVAARGVEPIREQLARVDAVGSPEDFARLLGRWSGTASRACSGPGWIPIRTTPVVTR